MDTKPNFNNDLSDIICDKDLVVQYEILNMNFKRLGF